MGRSTVKARERLEAQRRRASAGSAAMFVGDSNTRQMGRSAAKRRQDAKKKQKENARPSGPGFIERFDVTSNEKKSKKVSLVTGIVNLKYYESLLQDNVVIDVTYSDAGGTIDGKTAQTGLPIVGEENVAVKFKDNAGNSLSFADDSKNAFYVKKISTVAEDGSKSAVNLQLITKEAILNDKTGVEIRQDGKISDHVKKILTDKEYLDTGKELNIDETSNNLNYCFAKNKPFYVINRISKDAIPGGSSEGGSSYTGKSAGFLFYETYDGYYFRGIDTLFGQTPQLKIVYNQSSKTIPEGYDVKALTYSKENTMDVTKKLRAGFMNTKNIEFNPYNMEYNVSSYSAEEMEEYLSIAGTQLPVWNSEFSKGGENKDFSRTTFLVNVPGFLPEGTGLGEEQQQLGEKAREFQYDAKTIMNQSIMRYNQLVSQKVVVTIPGDFSLRAGDSVSIDVFELNQTKSKSCGDAVDKVSGGTYIIATLCHYLTPKQTFTKLVLIRDSIGRKPTAKSK